MKIKSIYYRYLFCCIFVFGLTGCEKENVEAEDLIQKSELDISNYKFSMTSYEHIKDIDKSIIKTTSKLVRSKKNDVQNSRLSSTTYDFYIDEGQVQIIEAEDYNSYTFVAKREYETANLLENYLYIHYSDDSYKQFLVSCNYTLEENGQYNFDQSTQIATEIFENSLLNYRVGCVMELVDSYEGTICTGVQCTGANHDPGEDCECDTSSSCEEAYISCETGTIYVYEENCSGGDSSTSGDNSNTGPDGTTSGGSGAGDGSNNFVWKPVKPKPFSEQLKGIINRYNITIERRSWIDDLSNFEKIAQLVNLANENKDDNGNISEEVLNNILELIDIMIANPSLSVEAAAWENYLNNLSEEEVNEYDWYQTTSSTLVNQLMDCFDNIKNDLSSSSTYSLTIYVEQPIPNSDAPNDGTDPGHTFISMSTNDPVNPSNNVTQTLGFHPEDSVNPVFGNNTSDGLFVNNGVHHYDVSATINLTKSMFYDSVDEIKTLGNDIPEYNLETYNCTDFGINIANSTGMSLPDTEGTWGVDVPLLGFKELGTGSNPGALGQDIRAMALTNTNSNITINITTGTNALASKGPCY